MFRSSLQQHHPIVKRIFVSSQVHLPMCLKMLRRVEKRRDSYPCDDDFLLGTNDAGSVKKNRCHVPTHLLVGALEPSISTRNLTTLFVRTNFPKYALNLLSITSRCTLSLGTHVSNKKTLGKFLRCIGIAMASTTMGDLLPLLEGTLLRGLFEQILIPTNSATVWHRDEGSGLW